MKRRAALTLLSFALTFAAANAQTNDASQTTQAEGAATPARETPPDAKAYQDAVRTYDPIKKIEALEKFRKDFPNSSSVKSVDLAILSTLASRMPEQEERIRALAKQLYDGAEGTAKTSMAGQIGETLVTNKVLLKDAEEYAKISLGTTTEAEYIADQKAQFEKRNAPGGGTGNRKPPTDEDLTKRYKDNRATRLSLLGRVEFQLGNMSEAQKLLDESYAANANQPLVAAALGELAAKNGDSAKAMDYLVAARLAGKAPASANETLSALYAKAHNGSTAGLSAMLDAEYNKRFPNPLKLDAYKPTEKRSDRLVLAEVFTGSGCPPCVGADLAFDAAMSRYSRKDLMVVMYHQHVPQPDPMTNPDTQARNKYYAVTGVPTYAVDGTTVKYNGAGREQTKQVFEHVQPLVEKDLETAAEAKITVNAAAQGDAVKVTASVDGIKSDSKDLKVHVLLLEKELTYSGENGIRFHPMVVRAMGGKDDDGFAVTAGTPASVEQSWDIPTVSARLKAHLDDYESKGHRGNAFKFIEKMDRIDRGNLAVVVFVQDVKTRHILQSAYVDLATPAGHVTAGEANQPK